MNRDPTPVSFFYILLTFCGSLSLSLSLLPRKEEHIKLYSNIEKENL